jgi:hypothetical protein
VYLWIHDGSAEIRDASHLWGKDTGETQAAIREELADPKIRVLLIGPAGERQVRFADNLMDNPSNRGLRVFGTSNTSTLPTTMACCRRETLRRATLNKRMT